MVTPRKLEMIAVQLFVGFSERKLRLARNKDVVKL